MDKAVVGKLSEIKTYVKDIEYLNNAASLLYWDMRTYIPKKAIPYRGEMLGYLSGEVYKLQTSDTMKEFIEYFDTIYDLDHVNKAMIKKLKKDYNQIKKIPADKYKQYTVLTANAEAAWEEAHERSDFNIFKPHLDKLIKVKKEFIEYLGYTDSKYDTLLDFYEPGATVEKLDKVFVELRDAILKLLNKIKNSKTKINDNMFKKTFKKEEQEEFSKFILSKMGYDFEAGRLDESTHPFTIDFGKKDVRITTSYNETEFRSALFSCIHEGGHAMYEQDIPEELNGTMLATGASMGVHESQSRFYENLIGRSKEFWTYFYPEVQKRFSQFEGVSLEEFYKAMNIVEPSLIRVDADELTYSLHVIIRYEIEKQIINEDVAIDDLPKLWNQKYKEYLGIEPNNDKEGILQDMHWSGGDFGYFPSYVLGNIYGAQFLNTMKKDIKDLDEQIKYGKLSIIHEWLKENIHKHGAVYEPENLMKMVTGENPSAKYFIDYLNDKYSEIYNLK